MVLIDEANRRLVRQRKVYNMYSVPYKVTLNSSSISFTHALYISRKTDMLSQEFDKNPEEFAKSLSMESPNESMDQEPKGDQGLAPTTPLTTICEDEVEEDLSESGVEPLTPHTKVGVSIESYRVDCIQVFYILLTFFVQKYYLKSFLFC